MKVRCFIRPTTDGRLGVENDARAFWQSRMTTAGNRADPIQLTDLTQLAKDIRRASATAHASAIAALPYTLRNIAAATDDDSLYVQHFGRAARPVG